MITWKQKSKEFEGMRSKREVYPNNYPTPKTDPMNKSTKGLKQFG